MSKPGNSEVVGVKTRAAEHTQRAVRPVVEEVWQEYIADFRNELKTMTTKGIKPQLEPFKGEAEADAEIWINRFEQYAKVCKWENEEPMQWFPFFLQEAARSWYHALPTETTTGTWKELKVAFQKRFQPHGAIKWARLDEFQMRKQGPNESVDIFVEDISRMGRQLERTKDQIKESVIRGLRTPIRNVVLQKDYNDKALEVIVEWAKQAEILAKAEEESAQSVTLQAITSMHTKMEEWRDEMKKSVETIKQANEINQMQQRTQNFSNIGNGYQAYGHSNGYQMQGRSNQIQTDGQSNGYQVNSRPNNYHEPGTSNGYPIQGRSNNQDQSTSQQGRSQSGRFQRHPDHVNNNETQCRRCGKYFSGPFSNHRCPAKDRTCSFCNKVGHFQSMCFSKRNGGSLVSQQ
jgi:hypothetical protein